MTEENRPAHSPLGASGAERWMNCVGSVALLARLGVQEESDEPDYRRDGTAAHEIAAHCLEKELDGWEVLGVQASNGAFVDEEMATAIQVYLDECRPLMIGARKVYIEHKISAPEVHPDFYGQTDFGSVQGKWLHVRDYKHGEGIFVEVEGNPQPIYYAYGLLRLHPEVENVSIGIVQPRFYGEEKIRVITMTAEEVRRYVMDVLQPAMVATQTEADLDAGPWCRFCPAKLICPLLDGLFKAASTYDPREIVDYSDEALGRSYAKKEAVKFYLKALDDEVYNRLNRGREITDVKLVHKKANRVFKPGIEDALKAADFTDKEIYTERTLKSPPEIEKLGGVAAALVKEYAYTPTSGLTVAGKDDRRVAVKVQSTTEAFAGAIGALAQQEGEST